MYLEVAFRLPLENAYTYVLPSSMNDDKSMVGKSMIGRRVLAPLRGRSEEGIVIQQTEFTLLNEEILSIDAIIDDFPIVTTIQIDLAKWMARQYLAGIGECLFCMFPSFEKPPRKKAVEKKKPVLAKNHQLNDEQNEIYRSVLSTPPGLHLVQGVTGSGKTELYIHLIEKVTQDKRGAILLVPEISLTVQMIERLQRVFGSQLALLHSALKNSERVNAYLSLLRGEKSIAVGTRSAVFAPVENLGIVVIDEEHDSSYKEHKTPRYDAREISMERSKRENAKILFGSATPRTEMRYFVKGKYYHRMESRAGGASLPTVDILPITQSNSAISGDLLTEIEKNLAHKEQTILLLNRRGHSPYVFCKSCEKSIQCINCSVSLRLHRSGELLCHLCGYKSMDSGKCPTCSSPTKRIGVGTQKLEDVLLNRFPTARLERLDTDIAEKREAVQDCISRFLAGEIDILLGTQMIAKGLDSDHVTLVGVLQADHGLYMPDFRSAERTFSLLTQVAGRAGRRNVKGRVFFEAENPNDETLLLASKQDVDSFYERELRDRELFCYPPFCDLLRLVIRSEEEQLAYQCALEIRNVLLESGIQSSETTPKPLQGTHIVLGPTPAPIHKVHNKFREHMVLKTLDRSSLNSVISNILPKLKRCLKRDAYLEIDFNPVDLL